MATESWSTSSEHSDNTTFAAWASELYQKFLDVGLVQTTDTGQIDWGSPPGRPSTNNNAGYNVFRFDDPMQGAAPIFFQYRPGTAGVAAAPRPYFRVGSGTDGAGNLTGPALMPLVAGTGSGNNGSSTPTPSYLCHVPGFLGLFWKQATALATFCIARTVDANGDPDGRGALVYWASGTPVSAINTQALRYTAGGGEAVFTARSGTQAMLGLIAQDPAATLHEGDLAAFLAWTILPRMTPLVGLCGVLGSEVAGAATFETTLVGSTPRTYLRLPNAPAGVNVPNFTGISANHAVAMLWE